MKWLITWRFVTSTMVQISRKSSTGSQVYPPILPIEATSRVTMFMKPLSQKSHSLQTVKPEPGSCHVKIPSLILLHKWPQWQHARTKQSHNDAQGKYNPMHVLIFTWKKDTANPHVYCWKIHLLLWISFVYSITVHEATRYWPLISYLEACPSHQWLRCVAP